MNETGCHGPAQGTPVAHIRLCIHVLNDFRAGLADAEVAAGQTNRVLVARVADNTVAIGGFTTTLSLALTLTVVNLIHLKLLCVLLTGTLAVRFRSRRL